jgi:hypothetical protein
MVIAAQASVTGEGVKAVRDLAPIVERGQKA